MAQVKISFPVLHSSFSPPRTTPFFFLGCVLGEELLRNKPEISSRPLAAPLLLAYCSLVYVPWWYCCVQHRLPTVMIAASLWSSGRYHICQRCLSSSLAHHATAATALRTICNTLLSSGPARIFFAGIMW